MAIKPSTAPPVFASNTNYDVDPLVPVALQGTATKVAPITIREENGQIPNVPPFAQNENFIINLETLWSIWVSEGEEIKLETAHIQETNEDGRLFAIGADFGLFDTDTTPLEVRPNDQQGAGDHGMICETSFDSPAKGALFQDVQLADPIIAFELRCHGSGTLAPMLIDSAFNAGSGVGDRPAMSVIANTPIGRGALEITPIRSTAIKIRHSGTALGAPAVDIQTPDSSTPLYCKQLDGNQPAARLEAFDGGANANAPLLLVPQDFDLAGSGAQSGSIWIHTLDDVVEHYGIQAYFGNSTRHIVHTRQPFCHARGESLALTTSETDPTDSGYKSLTQFSFPDDLVPHLVGDVRCKIHGRVRRSVTSTSIAARGGLVIRIVDVTRSDFVIKLFTRDLHDVSDEANDLFVDFTCIIDYTLVLAGKRTFLVEFKKAASETNSETIQVEDIYVTVDALP